MKKIPAMAGVAMFAIANMAQAHPGHDHGDWSSPLIHILFYGAIAAVIGTAFYVIRQSNLKRQQSKREDDQS